MRAMILAAGLGTRLRPLTDEVPKALLPIANHPQIELVLELLRLSGVREVIVNLHHLGDTIRSAIGARYRGEVCIAYSVEEEILGTAGGLKKAEWFFEEEPFILANADALMDVDLAGAVRRHVLRGAAATMVVREWEEGSALGRVEMDGRGVIRRILGRGGGESLTPVIFAGIHILSRRVFRYIPSAGFSCINRDCYGAMLEAGEVVCGFRAAGYWRDVGTPENYFGANMDFLAGVMPAHCRGLAGERRPSGVDVAPDVELIQPVVIGRHCRIGQGARIGPSVALGHGCTVGSGCNLERVVALPRSSFGDGEAAHSCIKSERATVAVCPAG